MPNGVDDFWDIDKLLPKKKKIIAPFSTREKTATVTVEGESGGNSQTKLTLERPSESSERTVRNYTDGFVRSVSITRFLDKYDFYGNFRKAALLYYDFKTAKCDFIQFYSFMPQYSQFNSQQKNFYFYWRDCVRRGKYIKTDYSYFYLYIYEILNLPDKIPVEKGLKMLIELWRAYRQEMPRIDANMSLWVQDYCMVYDIPCPMDMIGDFIFDVINAAEFKEFYLSGASVTGIDGVKAMVAYLSDYDWRRGKYAGGESKEAYAGHMISAMGLIVNHLWNGGALVNSINEHAHLSRSAFRNSLCTHSVKCRLDIEYVPLSNATELRAAMTGAVRYTENRLRAMLGVKSRLAIKDLPTEYKKIIDSYFDDLFDKVNRERRKEMTPEYEKLYDAECEEISFAGADEIERASWSTTLRLVTADGESEMTEDVVNVGESALNDLQAEEAATEFVDAQEADTYGLSEKEIAFLSAVSREDRETVKKLADEIGDLADSVAERINEVFSDRFGDVVIEGEGKELRIIEDYKEDIEEWLTNQMK